MGFLPRLPVPPRSGGKQSGKAAAKKPKAKPKAKVMQVWVHGNCQVRHRTAEAAARCRNA